MKRNLLHAVLAVLVCAVSPVVVWASPGAGQLTDITITGFQVVNAFIVIDGKTNDSDGPDVPGASRGCHVWVEGFYTHTQADGTWRVLVPRPLIGDLMDPNTTVEVKAFDIDMGVTCVKHFKLVNNDKRIHAKEVFRKLYDR